MTQQNRVDPWGRLVATAERGSMMGNRGILHDDQGAIVRQWATNTWVTCLLEFKGRKSPAVFRPGKYSKLFFLDEATAFAAGHRPCGECQRQRYVAFKQAWCEANGLAAAETVPIGAVERVMHMDRVDRTRSKVTFESTVGELPYGTFVEHDGTAWMVGDECALHPWSFNGYGRPRSAAPTTRVHVLTPASVVKAFAAGFRPHVHATALAPQAVSLAFATSSPSPDRAAGTRD